MGRELGEAGYFKADLTLGEGEREGRKKVGRLGGSILDCNTVLKESTRPSGSP